MAKPRSIKVGVPSGKLKLVLWEGTEDEEEFQIKAIKSHPYVIAYGIRYDLTQEEIDIMNKLIYLIAEERK